MYLPKSDVLKSGTLNNLYYNELDKYVLVKNDLLKTGAQKNRTIIFARRDQSKGINLYAKSSDISPKTFNFTTEI